MLDSPELARRLRAAMDNPQRPVRASDIAVECGVTPQAVNGWRKTGRIAKRHISTLARMTHQVPTYFLDDVAEPNLLPLVPGESDNAISISRLNVKASAGNGVVQVDDEYQIGRISVPELWVRKNIVCSGVSNLRIITIFGDSMHDTLDDGDLVFVDIGVRQIDRDGIYVVELDHELYIKRFERRPLENSVWMRSDNIKKHPDPHVIPRDKLASLKVLARAVFAMNGRKL